MNADEFPIIKELSSPDRITLAPTELKDLIDKTIFSVAIDDARPILKGCLFEINEGTLTSVALDGFRMAVVKKEVKAVVRSDVAEFEELGIRDWATIKNTLKDSLRDYIFLKTKRYPMIIPIIMEV